jgi:hypothetical protein
MIENSKSAATSFDASLCFFQLRLERLRGQPGSGTHYTEGERELRSLMVSKC